MGYPLVRGLKQKTLLNREVLRGSIPLYSTLLIINNFQKMTNEEKAKMIADQCKPCSAEFYSGIKQGVLIALNAEEKALKNAKLLDEIDEFTSKFYDEDDEGNQNEDGLISIGKFCAQKLGYF